MIFALPRQMQRWRHTSLPLLRCPSPRLLGLRTTKYQSQIYSSLRRLPINGRHQSRQSKTQGALPLLQITPAIFFPIGDQTKPHTPDGLSLSNHPYHGRLVQVSKQAFWKRKRLYRRTQARRIGQLRKDLKAPVKDRSRRGWSLPRAWTNKPKGPHHFTSRRNFKTRRRRYVIAHYENTQLVRRLYHIKSSLRARRARLAFILWKRAVRRAKRGICRPDQPASSKSPKIISHLILQKTIPKIRGEWNRLTAGKKLTSRKLGVILLCTLKICPRFAPRLIEAIFPCTRSCLPHYMIEDALCLGILRLQGIKRGKMSNPMELEQLTAISNCLQFLIRASPLGHIRMRYDAVTILFQKLSTDDLLALYELLSKRHSSLSTQSMLHLADRFAKLNTMKTKSLAVDIIQWLVTNEKRTFNINSPPGASICTSILKISEPSKHTKPIQLAQRLLALGMQPNDFIYNTLISLMWRSGDLRTAWTIYHQMSRLMEIKDCYTYNSLMIGSLRAGDIDSLERAFSLALTRSLLENTDWGAFLYVVWSWPAAGHSFPVKKGNNRAAKFRLMLEVYSRVFDLEPLKYLLESPGKEAREPSNSSLDAVLSDGIDHITSEFVPIIRKIPSPYRPDGLIKPDTYILRLMTCAYVRGLSVAFNVLEFHMRFDKLLKSGDPLVTDLVQNNPAIHNSIIKALCSFDMSRPVAYEILRDMLEANITTASAQQNDSLVAGNNDHDDMAHQHRPSRSRLPRPNSMTFNILIDALMLDGQMGEAENMLQMMRDQGSTPETVTWNILVRGYARLQNIDGTVWSLQRMEQEGHQSDDRTMAAFNCLSATNQKLALSKMEQVIEENRKTQSLQLFGEGSRKDSSTSGDNVLSDAELSDTVLDDLRREIEDVSRDESGTSVTHSMRQRSRYYA